ncbi:MAG: hypothetical protein H0U10_11895 [Chloroflexia bacterium]|nr:hypothetical protein [Chloroflexia bacterium]
MDTLFPMRLSRRNAVAAGAAAMAGIGLTAGATRAAKQRAVTSGGGIAGGGLIEGPDASFHVVLSGSRFTLEDDDVALFGFLQLFDPAQNLSMTSGEIRFYGQPDGAPDDTRELRGLITVTESGVETGSFPFVLTAVVAGAPGPEGDSLTLAVGAAAATPDAASTDDFAFELSGNLVSGDLTLLTFAFDEE